MTIHGENILWEGPLFGRLTKHAKAHLVRCGWQQLKNNDIFSSDARLALIWPNKSGPQFEMDDSAAAHIRPYPRHLTDVLDDKIRLAELLSEGATGTRDLLPMHITSLQHIKENKLYFVKHRHGAQGKSVYVYNHLQLKDWWTRTGKNVQNFVVQEEVVPQTYEGRKLVMRSHILMWHHGKGTKLDDSTSTRPHDATSFQFHVFDDVIVQHHATIYEQNSLARAAQISQAGNKHPDSQLLHELSKDHPARDIFPEIERGSHLIVSAYERWFNDHLTSNEGLIDESHKAMTTAIAPNTACFALLGLDWLLQSPSQDGGKPPLKLCEINSHPALGWGTMTNVPSRVFDKIVEQTLDLLLQKCDENSAVE